MNAPTARIFPRRRWAATLLILLAQAASIHAAWIRHAVDDSAKGADGVRLADVNGDRFEDITTGWEESGHTRLYLNPGPASANKPWPAVTVGAAPSVEDAVFADLDGDRHTDVVSACEGKKKSLLVHWAPQNRHAILNPEAWSTQSFPAVQNHSMWMFSTPMQIDGKNGIDLVLGSKGAQGVVGWLQSPPTPRAVEEWTFHPLLPAGWIMSIRTFDMDRDGDQDLLISDRKGDRSGVLWLQNPGPDAAETTWTEHRIGADGREVMFLDITESPQGHLSIAAAARPHEICLFTTSDPLLNQWKETILDMREGIACGLSKAVAWGDIDEDGQPDLVYTCGEADPPKSGVLWLKQTDRKEAAPWIKNDISGPEGIKFDRIELRDLDGDQDLDVLTCEERHDGRGLGVIWYENPLREPTTP